ncbi:MAG TPA: TIGR02266 family protein [Candidatus Methylomirabilis sp.]|nr:TIGR02266 family protein [Candidatus Methylomirabilis sp.]
MEKQERRAEPRAPVELEVHYRSAQEFLSAYTLNIGGGGIYIKTNQPLPLNREVHLRFTLPGIARVFDLHGLVVWTNPHPSRSSFPSGMGIKFMNLDSEGKKLIAEFVKAKLPAPPTGKKPSVH